MGYIMEGTAIQGLQEAVAPYREELDKLFGSKTWELKGTQSNETYIRNFSVFSLQVGSDGRMEKTTFAQFYISLFPGCCGVCVSHNTNVYNTNEPLKVLTILQNLQADLAKSFGYGLLVATDIVSANRYEAKFTDNDWKEIHKFINPRTNNVVGVVVKDLVDPLE